MHGELWESPCAPPTSWYELVSVVVFIGLMIDFIRTNMANSRTAATYYNLPSEKVTPISVKEADAEGFHSLMACFGILGKRRFLK
jgi:hypothetical protein